MDAVYTDDQIKDYATKLGAAGAPSTDIETFVQHAKATQGDGMARFGAIPVPLASPEEMKRREDQLALDKGGVPAQRKAEQAKKDKFVAANSQPGVPLDPDAMLSPQTRSRLSFESDPAKQVGVLAQEPGVLAARLSSDKKNVIATVGDGSGGKKDVLLHSMSPDFDIAGKTLPALKLGATGALAYGTGGLSLLPQAGAMFAGSAAIDAIPKVASRVLAGQDVEPGKVATDAAKEGALNAALPLTLAGGKGAFDLGRKFLTKGAGALESAVPGAAERLGVTTLPSMDTGSKVLARAENAAGLKSQNTALAGQLKAAEDRQLGLSGPAGVPSEEQVASKVQPIASKAALAAEEGVTTSKNQAATAAQQQIQAMLDQGLIPSNLPQSEAGGYLRSKLAAYAQKVKDEANVNYPAFYKLAEEKGVVLDAKPVNELVQQIAKEDPSGAAELLSPSIKQVKSVESRLNPLASQGEDTGVLDQFGRPIQAAAEPPPPLGFQEAINLRAIVRKKLNAAMDPLGDPVKRYYSKLDDALTQTIQNGVDSDKTGALKTAFDKARAAYSEGAQALEQGRLPKLFADAGDAGHVPDEKLVPSLVSGAGNLDALKAWKSVLDPKDYSLLKRQAVNHLIDSSQGTGGFIDAESFLSKINKLTPEVRKELLGPLAEPLTANSQLLASARGAKIDPSDLQAALKAAPGQAPSLLANAIEKQKAFDLQYNNDVAKALRGGNLGPNTLGNVDRFTSEWLGKAGTADVRQAMTQIQSASPETAQMVRQRALQNILTASRDSPELGQVTTGGNPNIDASKLAKYLSGAEREKYQVVLGKDGVQFLDDLATISEANAKRIAQGQGKPLTVEGDAERAAAILGGNELSLARELGRGALNVALSVPGNLIRNQAVSNYLKTGALPTIGRTAKTALLAAPEAAEQTKNVLAENKN